MQLSNFLQLAFPNECIVQSDVLGLLVGETLAWKHMLLTFVECVLITLPPLLPFITSVRPVAMNLWLSVSTHKLCVGP